MLQINFDGKITTPDGSKIVIHKDGTIIGVGSWWKLSMYGQRFEMICNISLISLPLNTKSVMSNYLYSFHLELDVNHVELNPNNSDLTLWVKT